MTPSTRPWWPENLLGADAPDGRAALNLAELRAGREPEALGGIGIEHARALVLE